MSEAVDWSRVRGVLFDAVGTVIHPDPPVAETYFAAAQQFGSSLTRDEIHSRFATAFAGQSLLEPTNESRELTRWRGIVSAVIDDVGPRAEELFQYLWHGFADGRSWRMYDDVPAAVRFVRDRGLKSGIASNFDGRLRSVVAAHPPLHSLDIFVSSELGYSKPAPGFFTAVESRMELTAAELLLVGDDWKNDVLGARTAGWQALFLNRKAGDLLTSLLRK